MNISHAPITTALDTANSEAMGAVAHHELAVKALASEIGDGREIKDVYVAAERACHKLSERLSMLVTVEGYRALLARAIQVAAVEFPFLDGLKQPQASDACLGDLALSDGVPKAMLHDGLTSVLAGVIGLSVTFIGEGLTLRAVQGLWPDAPPIGPDVSPQEKQQ